MQTLRLPRPKTAVAASIALVLTGYLLVALGSVASAQSQAYVVLAS